MYICRSTSYLKLSIIQPWSEVEVVVIQDIARYCWLCLRSWCVCTFPHSGRVLRPVPVVDLTREVKTLKCHCTCWTKKGDGRESHITGRSVHNSLIKRLWRNLYDQCTGPFHQLFWYRNCCVLLRSILYHVHCCSNIVSIGCSEWVSEQFLNGTSAQYRLYSAIQIKS